MNLRDVVKLNEAKPDVDDFGVLKIREPVNKYLGACYDLTSASTKLKDGLELDQEYNYKNKKNIGKMLLFKLDTIQTILPTLTQLLDQLAKEVETRNQKIRAALDNDVMSVE